MADFERGAWLGWSRPGLIVLLLILLLLIASVLACAPALSKAQSPQASGDPRAPVGPVSTRSSLPSTGSISGNLTDLKSTPMAGAKVVARNEATGVEAKTVTSKNGSYRLSGLEAGSYTLEAVSTGQGRGRLEGIYVAGGGYEARLKTAMLFVAQPAPELAAAERETKSQPLDVRRASDVPRVIPEALTPLVADPLVQEATRGLPVPARAVESVSKTAIATVPDNLRAAIAVQSLWNLALPGTRAASGEMVANKAGITSGVSQNATLALTEAAAGAVHAAMQAVRPVVSPALEGAQREDPVAPAVVSTIAATELEALPVTGRRWQDFELDTPAATAEAGGAQGPVMRGSSAEPAETSIDGAGTGLAFGEQGGSRAGSASEGSNGSGGNELNDKGQAWAGGRGLPVAEAAISAVRISAGNAEAEATRTAGGAIDVATARGSNGLHGQGFLFDRQNTWGAQNPFTQWVKQTAPATLTAPPTFTPESFTPPDHEAVWGVGVGSQIKRDKLFWFGAVDSYHRNDPGLATVKHEDEFFAQPSNDQMQVLSARLGLNGANPVAEGLGAYSRMLTTLDGLLGPAGRTAAQWVGFIRLDWEASERQRLTFEETGAHWNSPGGGLTRVSETYGSNSFGSSKASEQLSLARWEAFLTPNLLVVTQGSTGRTIETARADLPSAYEQTFLAPNVWGQLPQIVVDSRYGFTIGNPSRFGMGSYPDERVNQVQETVNWVRQSLLVRSGFELSHNSDATSLLRNETGTYNYSSVENFASDALVFGSYGVAGELNPYNQHNCDATGKVWRDSTGGLHGLGYLPCYSYYSQTLGPTNWNLSTNDWAGFTTVQWQPAKLVVVSGGLRWEREQLPPVIAAVANSALPLTEALPGLGNNWGPRVSVAVGSVENHWPVLRLGYGMYFGRTENATVETALTQTGSPKGDLNFFMRPTDNLNAGGAPPFPYVLSGAPASVVKPGVVEFAPSFHNPEVHQAVVAVEEELPAHVHFTASTLLSLGRRLPIAIDTNFDPTVNPGTITYAVVDGSGLGPIKTPQVTVPFYATWPSANSATGFAGRLNPDYQQITQVTSRANSTYEAAMFKAVRYGRRGLSLHASYAFAHAGDWNPNESTLVSGSDVLDPADFRAEYGVSNLDVRHSASVMAVMDAPWKLSGTARWFANGWMASGIAQARSGLPYTMRTSGSLTEEFDRNTGTAIVALGPGMNGSGGDNRVYGVGRNTFRYRPTWKADLRVGKKFDLGQMRELELLVETFNLFNHQNETELETTGYYIQSGDESGGLPSLNFLTGLKANTTEFGQPLNVNATNFYRERQIQIGLRMRF